MENKGWEFRTDVVIFENKDWRINGYVNFSRNENKITELPANMVQENYSPKNGAYAARAEVGLPYRFVLWIPLQGSISKHRCNICT